MTKKQKKSLIALLIVFAVLTVGFFAVVRPLINRFSEKKTADPLDLLEGESYYYNQGYHSNLRVLFPQFMRNDLYSVTVWNKDTNYQFVHVISDAAADADNYFLLGTDSDGDGKTEVYMPEISTAFPGFEYSTLYDDTSKIPSVISVTGSCFFKDRIYVRAEDESNPDEVAYREILSNYGLAPEDNPSYYEIHGYRIDPNMNLVYAYYEDLLGLEVKRLVYQSVAKNGSVKYYTLNTTEAEAWSDELGRFDFETYGQPYTGSLEDLEPVIDPARSYKVFIGDRTPDRSGYYLRVQGRDVVYTTGTTSIGDVVNKKLAYYVNPRVMAESGETYGSYMALDFQIWQKAEALSKIKEGSGVLYSMANLSVSGVSYGVESGMIHLLKDKVDARLYTALLQKAVGDKFDVVMTEKIPLYSPLAAAVDTDFVFYSIDGVVYDDKVDRTAGKTVSAGDTLLVTYRITAGEEVGELYSGAIDLSDPLLPDSIKTALVGKTIGGDKTGEAELVRVTVPFDESYADAFIETYKIAQIIGFASDESLSDMNTINNAALPTTGYAQIYCTVTVNGVEEGRYLVINLEEEEGYLKEMLRRALVGKANGVPTKAISVDVLYPYSPITAYTCYEDFEVLSISEYAEQLSFKFVNALDRDKFYGSSTMYEITGPVNRTMYTLNASSTNHVLNSFRNLVGSETVAIGLTADVIKEYGLDEHVFYFDYPFGIGEDTNDGSDKEITYTYVYSVPYCIYVSAAQEDGSYYVGSTLYNTVVLVTADQFGFIDWNFMNDWMHSSILQLSVHDIAELAFDINFSDLKEKHSFALSTNSKYYVYAGVGSDGKDVWDEQQRLYASYVEGDIEYEYKNVSSSKVVLDNRNYAEALAKDPTLYYTQAGILVYKNGAHYTVRRVTNGKNLDQMYLDEVGEAIAHGYDFDGVYNLKNLILKIFTTNYTGEVKDDLTEAEKTALMADESNRIFNIRLQMTDGRNFNLGFYRYSDGRCLVRFSNEDAGTVNTDLYLNALEVKGLVAAVRALANAKPVDTDVAYTPDV